jgi:hypothetical protein
MEKKQNTPPSLDDWKLLPLPIKIYIGWIIFRSTQWKKIEEIFIKRIRRIDLWLLPPLAFFGAYKSMMQMVPLDHPMGMNTVLASSFMCAVLVQLIIRPITKKRLHWIK